MNDFVNTRYTILTNAALEAFTAELIALTTWAHDFSADAVQRGDKVKVLWVPSQSAAFDFAGDYAPQDVEAEGWDVEINRHKVVSWSMTDTEISLNPIVNIESFGRQKGIQLATSVLADIWSMITVANFPLAMDPIELSAFDSDSVIEIKEKCDQTHWPRAGRNLIIDTALFAGLLRDGSLKDASAFGGSEAIRQGAIPALIGFGIYDSTLVPENEEGLVGMAVLPDAMLTAMRYLAPQEGNTYLTASAVTNDAGFTLGFRDFYENRTGRRIQVLECNYGFRQGNPDALIRIVEAGAEGAAAAKKAA